MTTATKDPIAEFTAAYGAAGVATSGLRAAYDAVDAAERTVALAVAREREAARVALVEGTEHRVSGRVHDAQEALQAAREQLIEHKAADEVRQSALSLATRGLVDGAGKDALATAIEQLIDAGDNRLSLAVDELAAARRQLATTVGMVARLDGSAGPLRENAGLSTVAGLRGPNGDAFGWDVVEGELRGLGATARGMLAAFAARKAPPVIRVPESEMLQWHLAGGGSFSDSAGEVREHYLEQGPRRGEAAKDAQDRDSGRTRDMRTWL